MNKTEFLQGLGLAPPRIEPEEIRVQGKHAKRVALKSVPENPNSDAEAGTKQELAALNTKVAVLEKEKQDSNALTKVLAGFSDAIAELKATIEELLATNSELGEKVTALEEAKPEPANPEKEAVLENRIKELEEWKATKLAEEAAVKVEEAEATKKEPQEKDLTKTWPLNIIFG